MPGRKHQRPLKVLIYTCTDRELRVPADTYPLLCNLISEHQAKQCETPFSTTVYG